MLVHLQASQDGIWRTKELPEGVPLVPGEDLRDPVTNSVPKGIQFGGECPSNPPPPEPPVLHREEAPATQDLPVAGDAPIEPEVTEKEAAPAKKAKVK